MQKIYEQVAAWDVLFKKLGVKCTVGDQECGPAGLYIPSPAFAPAAVRRNPQIVVVPRSVDVNALCELFKDALQRHGVHGAIAPVEIRMPKETGSKTHQLSDMISCDDRTGENGSYAQLFRKHFCEIGDHLVNAQEFDTRMTLAEALWYHILLIEQYGHRYFELNYSELQTCRGTRGGKHLGSNAFAALNWDMHDVKVSLEWK